MELGPKANKVLIVPWRDTEDVVDRIQAIRKATGASYTDVMKTLIRLGLKNYKPVKAPRRTPLDTPALDQSTIHDTLFELFWMSGIRKVNRKKTKPIFIKLLVKATPTYERAFTDQLINDIHKRLDLDQLGFSEMHPTTYLNGERWNDEKPIVKPDDKGPMDRLTSRKWGEDMIGKTTE